MCVLKINNGIHDRRDVNDLVAGIILRQTKEFDEATIVDISNYYLEGSRIKLQGTELNDIVGEKIRLFLRNQILIRNNNKLMLYPIK